jgi:hypothetical protein
MKDYSILISIFSFVVAAGSVVIARMTYKQSKYLIETQVFKELIKEYSDEKMGRAVAKLWKFYNDICQQNESVLIDEYKKRLASDGDEEKDEKKNIHWARRTVAHFYHQLAYLYSAKLIKEETINKIWARSDFEIIPKILMPIEKRALPEAVDNSNQKGCHPAVELMEKLYKETGC